MAERENLDVRLWQAIERLGQARRAHVQEIATRRGLSPLQLELLVLLDRDRPPANRAGELARELDLSAATIADAVAALRRKALVGEQPDPSDARRKLLRPTREGAALAREVREEHTRLVAPLAGLSGVTKATALDVLLRVIRELHADGVITVDRSCRTCRHYRRSGGAAGYCQLLRTPLTRESLRVDCPEHEPAAA